MTLGIIKINHMNTPVSRRCRLMIKRRVRRPKNQEDIYKELTDKNEFGVFSSYKDIFMIAGLVGYLNDKRVEFEKSAEGIDWGVFNMQSDETVINSVALNTTHDLNILIDNEEMFDKKIKIYEEFAAGGIPILYEKIQENKRYASNTLFDLIMEMKNYRGSKEHDIAAIADIISFE